MSIFYKDEVSMTMPEILEFQALVEKNAKNAQLYAVNCERLSHITCYQRSSVKSKTDLRNLVCSPLREGLYNIVDLYDCGVKVAFASIYQNIPNVVGFTGYDKVIVVKPETDRSYFVADHNLLHAIALTGEVAYFISSNELNHIPITTMFQHCPYGIRGVNPSLKRKKGTSPVFFDRLDGNTLKLYNIVLTKYQRTIWCGNEDVDIYQQLHEVVSSFGLEPDQFIPEQTYTSHLLDTVLITVPSVEDSEMYKLIVIDSEMIRLYEVSLCNFTSKKQRWFERKRKLDIITYHFKQILRTLVQR